MLPVRKNPRLKGYDYSLAGCYFVTIVAQDRFCLFGHITDGIIDLAPEGIYIQKWLDKIPDHYPNAHVLTSVIMPNHLHVIIQIEESERKSALSQVVAYFKYQTTRDICIFRGMKFRVWQRNYYDHIIRDEEEHRRISEYIKQNPTNWEEDSEFVN